jgi:DNA-binding response OmpR family regulator
MEWAWMVERAPLLVLVRRERNGDLVADRLAKRGYDVKTLSSLPTGTDFEAMATSVLVAIVDVDGFSVEVLERVAALEDHGVPVVLLTGSRDALDRRNSDHVGATVLEKPVSPQELAKALDRVSHPIDAEGE